MSTSDNPADYTVFNSYDVVKVNSNSSFTIPVNKSKPTFSFAVSDSGSHIYMGITMNTQEPITIDAQSTAEALVVLNPLLVPEDEDHFFNLINLVKSDPSVKSLAHVIDEVYASSKNPLDNERITDSVVNAVLSILNSLEKSIAQSKVSYKINESQFRNNPLGNLQQPKDQNSQLQIQNFDMAVLTLENSSGSTLKIDTAEVGPCGIKTNTSWIVDIFQLDANKIDWKYSTPEWPVPIYFDDLNNRLILKEGFSEQLIVEGKIASGWLGSAIDPIGFVADYLGSKVISDRSISIEHEGIYAILAFSGSLLNEGNELSTIKSIDWQRKEWINALTLNIICAGCDTVGLALNLPEISQKTGEDFSKLIVFLSHSVKETLSEYPDITSGVVISLLEKTIDELLEFALHNLHPVIKEIQNEGIRKYFHIAINTAGKVVSTWSGSISLSTRLLNFFFTVTPREAAVIVLGAPWKQYNNPPQLSNVIISGTGTGDGGTGDITITYDLTDIDNDICSIMLEYQGGSAGTIWTSATITGETFGITPGTGKTIVWHSAMDEDGYNASDYKIRITPHDGAEAGTADISQAFAINNGPILNNPPIATITSPLDGSIFTEGNEITFTGTGTDPEDGTLTGDCLVCTSDKDGQIGTGESFSISTLSIGTHIITLTATDSNDAMGTDCVTITIESKNVTENPWPMFQHDPQHTGKIPYLGPQTNTVKWTFTLTEYGISQPVIASDGIIYLAGIDSSGHLGKLYAINPNGSLKWISDSIPISGYCCFFSTLSPTISPNGTIYIGGLSGLHAFNPDGNVKWTFVSEFTYTAGLCMAVADNGTVYATAGEDGYLFALNPNGSLEWSYQTGDLMQGFHYPAIGKDGTLYITRSGASWSQGGVLESVSSQGILRWQKSYFQSSVSDPVIGSEETIYIQDTSTYGASPYRFCLKAIKPNGELLWEKEISTECDYCKGNYNIPAPAIYNNEMIVVSGCHDLKAFNPDGTIKWTFLFGSSDQPKQPIIDADGTVYVPVNSTDSKLAKFYAINSDGTIKWSYITGPDSSPLFNSPPAISSSGILYISLSESGSEGKIQSKLYAFGED